MSDFKQKLQILKKIPLQSVIAVLLIVLAFFLVYHNKINSFDAVAAKAARVQFEGEYRIADGQWQEIVEGQHISSTKGDVTLRGNFHLYAPDGEYIGIFTGKTLLAFYTDHISLTFHEPGIEPYLIDHENPLFQDSACGVSWTAYSLVSGSTEPIDIIVHNPHRFGNETAIDELLSNVAIWGTIDFERNILSIGANQRNLGLFFTIVSFILLGIGLFSSLLHVKNNRIIWQLGMVILFAGLYLTFSSFGVSFFNNSNIINTTVLGIAMMLYMFFIFRIICNLLKETRKTGLIATSFIAVVNGICFIIPVLTEIYFYDTWFFWVIAQTGANFVMIGCLMKEFIMLKKKEYWFYIGLALLLVAYEIDLTATWCGAWKGGLISSCVFVILFVVALIIILNIIPRSINDAAKSKELELNKSRLEAEKNKIEAELKESRISLMLSQIQPHFIYNTLGTIERMCLKDPEKAFELVRNFSLYLRGNFSELESTTPIRFTEEMKHVEYYVNIEKVRFPDMNIEYHLEFKDFTLPALSVQPLVENAIKHGLMRLETGGTVVISSYETPAHFCVEVKDDGVGFEPKEPIDEKKHVGLRNIRGRLKAMVNGELLIESEVGKGTKATIMIPKDGMI